MGEADSLDDPGLRETVEVPAAAPLPAQAVKDNLIHWRKRRTGEERRHFPSVFGNPGDDPGRS